MATARSALAPGEVCSAALEAHRPAVERVILAMRERLTDPPTLRDMADLACLSPYHFNRVFRRITGIPPGEFLAALRLDAAKRLLLTTDLSVTEVCFALGYHSLGTFTSRFTQLTGLPPGQLRRLAARFTRASLDPYRFAALSCVPPRALASRSGARILAPEGFGGLIFVGLFPSAIPQGLPAGCAIMSVPGPYAMPRVPDGRYHVLAAALPWNAEPRTYLLPAAPLRVGRSPGPVVVRGGLLHGRADVPLRPLQVTDPPILIALPHLLTQRAP
jgi:AraC-like DNA-binding protein